ncbi:MAG: cytochrome P460 family protein [Nitrospira sp.]|nr:cytochrome P460 family protein [Nitrospira sp.]
MNTSGKMLILVGTLVLSAFLAGTGSAAEEKVVFNKDGSLDRPVGYRGWVHVGSTILPKGSVNIIENKPIPTNEIINTYVKPWVYDAYMKTGLWPEGTMIVKEFVALGEPDEDGLVHEIYFAGLAALVKDSKIFPAQTGHLGYFAFGHQREPYLERAVLADRFKCSSCHEKLASDQQYIFGDRHIGLRR